jgi:hypothetical protein
MYTEKANIYTGSSLATASAPICQTGSCLMPHALVPYPSALVGVSIHHRTVGRSCENGIRSCAQSALVRPMVLLTYR